MAKEALFNFEPERLLKKMNTVAKHDSHTATVNAKHGIMNFSSAYIRDNNAKNKFIKFYADSTKKAIGWKLISDTNLKELEDIRKIRSYEHVTKKGKTQTFTIGIRALLNAMNIKDSKTFKKLVIKKYDSKSIYQDTLHYIELK